MPGIIFFKTKDLERIRTFYIDEIGMTLWLDQGACLILRKENLLLGFCAAEVPDTGGTITFFYKSRREVEAVYERIRAKKISAPAENEPTVNEKYRIFQFFAKDFEGRTLEFQSFLHDIDWDFNG